MIADISSVSLTADSNLHGDGTYTYSEGETNVNIFITIDGYPAISEAFVVRDDSTPIDLSKVMVSTTRILFIGPLHRNDSGTYNLIVTNPAGSLSEQFRINIQCKCIMSKTMCACGVSNQVYIEF